MHVHFDTRAVTLTELVISTAVVGIIMLGVVSSDYAIRQKSDAAFSSASSTLGVQAMINHIIRNAAQAIGDGTGAGKGILDGAINQQPDAQVGDPNTFCIRQDLNVDGSDHNPLTPGNYTDDRWVCYTVQSNSLFTCNRAAVGKCILADNGYNNLGQASAVGRLFDVQDDNGPTPQTMLFTVTVTVPDPSGNPKSLTSSVSPAGHRI